MGFSVVTWSVYSQLIGNYHKGASKNLFQVLPYNIADNSEKKDVLDLFCNTAMFGFRYLVPYHSSSGFVLQKNL